MFTGLIQNLGELHWQKLNPTEARARIQFQNPLSEPLVEGESIAVNGVCLTALKIDGSLFEVDISSETLQKSALAKLKDGELVHLERALKAQDRLGGHLVQGHVDETGQIQSITSIGDYYQVVISCSQKFHSLLVDKASVAIDGVSLTVNHCENPSEFDVMIIPHTWKHTRFQNYKDGDAVNLEVDIVAKYVAKQFAAGKWEQLYERA